MQQFPRFGTRPLPSHVPVNPTTRFHRRPSASQGSFRNTGPGERALVWRFHCRVKVCSLQAEICPNVAAVFALVSLIFAAFAAAFAWSGVKVALDGQAVAAVIAISVGVFVFYGS